MLRRRPNFRLGMSSIPTLFATCLAITVFTSFQYDKKDHGGVQDKDKDKSMQPAGGGMDMGKMSPEQQKEMEAMMKAGTPGAEQERLMKLAGTWDAENTMWMDPSAPPMKSKGVMKYEPMFGNRYLHMHYKGDAVPQMGMPEFEGAGVIAYDNTMKKYVSVWFDSMSTGVMTSYGTADSAAKKFEYKGEVCDPVSNKMVTCRQVITATDDNHHSMEMYMPGRDGKEMKMMEIKYTRKS